MTSVVSCVRFLLGVVSFIVLVVETVVVSRWGKLGVMELFVVITNSLHVFRSINNIWVVWRNIIISLSPVESFGEIVKFIPLSAFLSLRVDIVMSLRSKSVLYDRFMSVVMSLVHLSGTDILNKEESGYAHG